MDRGKPPSSHRLLIVGNGDDSHVGAMFFRAATRCGLSVQLVDMRTDLTTTVFDRVAFRLRGRRHPGESAFNRRVLSAASSFRPTVMLVTGLMPVRRSTLEEIGHGETVTTVNFMTDDPFNPAHKSPTALQSIPAFDLYLSTKPAVDSDLRNAGARRVCRSWFAFDPALHFREPAPIAEGGRWAADLTFIGGADRDRASLLAPARQWSEHHQASFAVFGGLWNRFPDYAHCDRGLALGRYYRYAMAGAEVLLCPVRQANRDGHSMRTFEAPAAGAFMLMERTSDHSELFEEGSHAAFFSGADELRDKAAFYLDRASERHRMAAAAHAMITSGGHTYSDRLKEILQLVSRG
jgi:spore maturation protein CgeB